MRNKHLYELLRKIETKFYNLNQKMELDFEPDSKITIPKDLFTKDSI
jgi:hypothetical protein